MRYRVIVMKNDAEVLCIEHFDNPMTTDAFVFQMTRKGYYVVEMEV